ncbi:uncharacterized protein LOC114245255 [Bombyx mandarina]|uniref:Uncharacterized protein LOC114245255 n=1 Tax=Bombyx mandarina TaxID=7092 RepID=A0A6J2JYE1_BOMMA|nr:uncharacterized protein LOC114245255 [Bombyx mandarina]
MYTGFCFLLISICALSFAKELDKKQREKDYVPLKYPGPIQDVGNRYGSPDSGVPEECRDKNFCTIKPPDYPQARFNDMFKDTEYEPQPNLVIEAFGDRQGDPDAEDNCPTDITFEPLFLVRSRSGDWRTVVQAPEKNYLQKVRLETCKQVGGTCFVDLNLTPDIVTFCKQKYSVWEFLVDDGKNGTETIQSELPICCSCHYKIKERK